MKKELTLVSLASLSFIFLFIFVLTLSNLAADIIINEVELNPQDTDSGNEWVEFYSQNYFQSNNLTLKSNNGREFRFNLSFTGYYSIITPYNLLTNTNQTLSLYVDNIIISNTIIIEDSANDQKTWQYCSGNWYFRIATKNNENNCTIEQGNINNSNENNTSINNSSNNDNNNNLDEDEKEITLKFDWNDQEIINNQEFEIEIKASNLENEKYDLKVWIVDDSDNDKIISEIYNEDEEKWQSGNYYIDEILKGSGSDKTKVKLRLKKDYQDFEDKTKIYAKLRLSNKIVCEEKDKIEIIKNDQTEINNINNLSTNINYNQNIFDDQINDLSKIEPNVIYDSLENKYLSYSIFISLFFLVICILLIIIKRVKIKRAKIQ